MKLFVQGLLTISIAVLTYLCIVRWPMVLLINPIFFGTFWLILHPPAPIPWFPLICWLVWFDAVTPFLPWGTYIILGLGLLWGIRFIQRRYIPHTHLLPFLLLTSAAVGVWDVGVIFIISSIQYILGEFAYPFGSLAHLTTIIIGEMIIVAVGIVIVSVIESRINNATISTTLQRYYEQIQRPHFRSHTSSIA